MSAPAIPDWAWERYPGLILSVTSWVTVGKLPNLSELKLNQHALYHQPERGFQGTKILI